MPRRARGHAILADVRDRALRHHAESNFWAERMFDAAMRSGEGKDMPVRYKL